MKTIAANSERGMTLIEVVIALLVIAVLALMVAILPVISRSHRPGEIRNNCFNNLRQIELALKVWAVDNNDRFPMQVTSSEGGTLEASLSGRAFETFLVMSNELSAMKLVICPTDSKKTVARSFGDMRSGNVSYFIGVDVTDTNLSAFLVGDRNLALDDVPVAPGLSSFATNSLPGWTAEMHVKQGNVGLGDGSVMQFSVNKLRDELSHTGFVTNRLAVP